MPTLPVLSRANRVSERLWHDYIRKVYHQSPFDTSSGGDGGGGDDGGDGDDGDGGHGGGEGQDGAADGASARGLTLDLNALTFFYADEPAVKAVFSSFPCLRVCPLYVADNAYEGTPWTGAMGPENVAPNFFVARPFLLPSAVPRCDRLEVLHVHADWAGPEVGVSWFFHAVGSGVFLDCHNLPVQGGIAAYRTRKSMSDDGGEEWPGDGSSSLATWMDERHLAMLVITEADFSNIYGPGGNPRTEIIVRQRQGRPESDWFGGESESGQPHRSCLTDEPFGFSWLTGLGGSKPCECVPSDRLNCDATSG